MNRLDSFHHRYDIGITRYDIGITREHVYMFLLNNIDQEIVK